MRRVRFMAQGHYHEGIARDDHLLGEAGRGYDPETVTWLPPVDPPKIIGLALNYADHAAELELKTPEAPALFFKPRTSLVGHRAPVVYPTGVEYMHYEAELAVVIGRRCKRVSAERAYDVVRGYTVANDVTVRDFVANLDRPPVKAKGWDSFGPLGPWLVEGEIADPAGLAVRSYVNGELRQQGNTADFIHGVPAIIEFISFFMTLEENDVILTGTPKGLSHVYAGDTMRVEVEGIGALENPVVAE